jgi:hypothetical protein
VPTSLNAICRIELPHERPDCNKWGSCFPQVSSELIELRTEDAIPESVVYWPLMTHQLSEIMERVKTWPDWRQDDAVYLLEMLEESGTSVYRLSDEERDTVQEGLASPVVSDSDLKRFRNRHNA